MNWKTALALRMLAPIGGLLALATTPCVAETLYVFVPTEVRANVLQQQISDLCPGIEVTVFGRGKDFEEQVTAKPPDAVLSLLPVIEHSGTFNMLVKGVRNGATDETYVLVSVDNPPDLKKIADLKIGVMDLLGKKSMNDFITQIFQTELKQVKRVTKVEDLLPLLTFGSVDTIFVSESFFTQMKKNSNLNLVATKLNVKIGLVSAGLLTESSKSKFQQCIGKFNKDLNSVLGVDQWRAL